MNIPEEIVELFKKFTKSKYQLYLVGGSVRDILMGRERTDWDFTTDAKPEQILKFFPQGFYNNKFGTVGIPLSVVGVDNGIPKQQDPVQNTDIIEITTMRKEGDYKDHRHPVEVSWTGKIKEDLARRDFTINAIALLPKNTESSDFSLVDPFNGQQDIKSKLIRAVGNPNTRFQEDALRLMRAIRFSAQLDFEIEENTFNAIKDNAQSIKEIAWERIRDELFKILPTKNAELAIRKLKETGILKIILPELEACFGIQQEGPKHDRVYDIGEHSLLTLKYCPSNDPLVKFAALLHDIGKSVTVKISDDNNVTFYNHDVVGGHLSLKIAKRFNLSKIKTDKLFKLIRFHMFSLNENQTDSAIRRFIKNVGLKNVNDMMDLRIGDRLGGGTQKAVSWRMEKFKERINQVLQKPFSITDLKVSGYDIIEILNIKPGPKVGMILKTLFEMVLKDASKNKREILIQEIKSFKE